MTVELANQYIFIGAILALLCVVASFVSRKLGAPILLVFLLLGMLAGEDGPGALQFDDAGLAFFLGNLALAIIIFDGGLGTRRDTFRVSLKPALTLATLGVLITAGITGLAAFWILPISLYEALLIGAIVGSTDAAAVFGLLRFAGLELKERTSGTLEMESGTNDPMAIFLTVTLVQVVAAHGENPGLSIAVALIQQMGLGLALGFACGHALVWGLRRLPLPASLYPLFVLAGGVSVFGLTNLLGGSGFLAIYLVGLVIGNAALPYSSDIHRFHDGMAWLSQIGMFLMLGLLVTPSHLLPITLPAVAIALVLIFIARPLAVMLSLLPFRFPWREQVFISWCGLRGAVPIILALFPSLEGMENTRIFFELVFFVVLISLVLQGWTIAPLARWLRIELPASLVEPEHFRLALPDAHDKVFHIYDTPKGCKAIGTLSQNLPLDEGTQLIGLVRDGVFEAAVKSQQIQPGDRVMLLGDGVGRRIGPLFAAPFETVKQPPLPFFFGEFTIAPESTLQELASLYGFVLPAQHETDTVAAYLEHKFHGKAVVGDRVELGHVQFVVREMVEGRVAAVGLKLMTS